MNAATDPRIVQIEWAELRGERPRHAGRNARLGDHGITVRVPIARLTTEDGSSGFGPSTADEETAQRLIGQRIDDLFNPLAGSRPDGMPFDIPLWDLMGKHQHQPVYALAAAIVERTITDTPLRVPCYDTSLYFDDLHLTDTALAAELLAAETAEGYERGHRNFKIKVGRGARHMPLEEGTERDIAIVSAVRAAAGAEAKLMIDANNGYNLNLTKRVLAETADSDLFWIEEAFHEDAELYRDLKEWMAAEGLSVLIADGEGQASPLLLDWARAGIVDVIQYDIFGYGFTPWLGLGQQLARWGVRTAPHHYGRHLGNAISAHLAAAIDGFTFVEWDEATTPGIDASAYCIETGQVVVPETPGFGLLLDEEIFQRAVARNGYCVTLA
jgi:L-alanine-DL-glutamate epimerase-like enolase superfamily enzyme